MLFPLVDTLHSTVETLQKKVGQLPEMVDKRVTLVVEEVSILIDVDEKVDNMLSELNLLKRVVGREEDRTPMSKVKILDPKPFAGACSAKELEDFLWDIKMYFQAARVLDVEIVSITDMYLIWDVKLWISYSIFFGIASVGSDSDTYLQDSVRSAEKKDSLMSAMQVKNSLRHGEQTYLAALIEIKPDIVQEVQNKVVELLKEFKDVFPSELPKMLPARRAFDHAIELKPGPRPPAQAPYSMAPTELTELRKQFDRLLEARMIQPSKLPYGSPVFFRRKQDGSMRMCMDIRHWTRVRRNCNKIFVGEPAEGLLSKLAKANREHVVKELVATAPLPLVHVHHVLSGLKKPTTPRKTQRSNRHMMPPPWGAG
ncbi:UNVERIFIED_CONTAM: hypothetical protein Scaly_1154100 [Sesamum calycinum]|uniref:RNA-directed DNA polymerase-like protein n=1 Tax=Sesamum calycinum TaxID=2727403 RepID=A0AAW2Q2A6_9LAMI